MREGILMRRNCILRRGNDGV
ncbi:hypothetical protein E2C01_084542 [Portunus trituberculatus]|uniref:Uncharacterized protein n=1 Tax=Portunus trituberculatus TaxID=210409 RepID=A0A5B7J9J9_PORTR|nr:hypothetical protein [Portunus trituberculatus]